MIYEYSVLILIDMIYEYSVLILIDMIYEYSVLILIVQRIPSKKQFSRFLNLPSNS